jgi:hypothetical protein
MHSFTLRRIVVSLTGMPSLAISRSEARPPTLWPNSLTFPANRAVRGANGVASVESRSAKTIQSGSPDSMAVTVRFGAGAQDANVFITFDAVDRHTMQARASLHRD